MTLTATAYLVTYTPSRRLNHSRIGPSMTSPKTILEQLTKADLVLLSRHLGHGGWSVFTKAELVQRIGHVVVIYKQRSEE